MHLERHLRRVVFGTARAVAKTAQKLHLKVRRTGGEPQLSLFFKLLADESCALALAIGGPNVKI